jgi:hypothetical protein
MWVVDGTTSGELAEREKTEGFAVRPDSSRSPWLWNCVPGGLSLCAAAVPIPASIAASVETISSAFLRLPGAILLHIANSFLGSAVSDACKFHKATYNIVAKAGHYTIASIEQADAKAGALHDGVAGLLSHPPHARQIDVNEASPPFLNLAGNEYRLHVAGIHEIGHRAVGVAVRPEIEAVGAQHDEPGWNNRASKTRDYEFGIGSASRFPAWGAGKPALHAAYISEAPSILSAAMPD